jgi:hypothetical protein
MKTKGSHSDEIRFDPSSWATLLFALGFIAGAGLYLFLAFRQPADGWVYETRLDGQLIVVGSLSGEAGPLIPGDTLLAIEGKPASTTDITSAAAPPDWQIGGTAHYLVQRAGDRLDLQVPLIARSASMILRVYALNGTILPTYLLWCLIGFIVFFLRPRETAARLLMLFSVYWNTMDLIVSADTTPAPYYYPPGLFWANIVLNSLWLFMFAMILHFALVFPVRKWPLTRWPRLSLALLYGIPAAGTALALSMNQISIYDIVLGGMILVVFLAIITATVHNLRFIHDPAVRAQIGWVALGISAPIMAVVIVFGLQGLLPDVDTSFTGYLWQLAVILLPLCFGIAITRYRLFDIEIIIRRTLQYTLLTVLLALIYFGSVVLLQSLFTAVGGQQSPVVIVLSTLIIAALFSPLRHRIQDFIDRRFYRKKYDAAKMLQVFAQSVRSETDLDKLTAELVHIAGETMQPVQLSVWLKDTWSGDGRTLIDDRLEISEDVRSSETPSPAEM